jgi:hypothetical protein
MPDLNRRPQQRVAISLAESTAGITHQQLALSDGTQTRDLPRDGAGERRDSTRAA